MDGLSIAASIIAVVDVSVKVISLCSQYSKTVANSHADASRLAERVKRLKITLDDAQALIASEPGGSLSTSRQLLDQLAVCRTVLQNLQEKLERAVAHQGKRRFWLRALKWPFTKDEIDALIISLEGYRSSIMDGLQLDQT